MTGRADIAIVGMACVFPRAHGLKQYWSNLVNGVDAVTDVPSHRWTDVENFNLPAGHVARLPIKRGAFLPQGLTFDPLRFGIIPKAVQSGDPDEFLMLQMIDAALCDAKVADDAPVRERTDVIIGRGGYGTAKHGELTLRCESFHLFLELLDRKFPELLAGGRRDEIERYLQSTLSPRGTDGISTAIPNIVTSRAANRLNLCGAAFIVDAACASSLIALEQAIRRLRNGECDLAVVGGLFLTQTPTFWHVFDLLGGLSPSGVLRPFDRRADGLVVGEGGGAVILKRSDDAARDENRVYALIKGVGSASDGLGLDVMAPSSRGQVRALERAYQDANLDPATISYLEAHGTATIVGDLVEIESIKSFFGTSPSPPTQRGMGSVKSMIGHTMPASGIASLIKVALALSNKIIPPSLHCEEPRPELVDAPFYLVPQTRPWIHDTQASPRRAGINAFGFGGINVHAVLEEVPPASVPAKKASKKNGRARKTFLRSRPIEAALERPSELAVFSGSSTNDLAAKLDRLRAFLDRDASGHTLADVTCSLADEVDFAAPCKLALVCENLNDLRSQLAESRKILPRGSVDSERSETIYFSADAPRPIGKIACVFPGMAFPGLAGNYPDHLMELCLHYPELRAEFDFFESRDRHPDDDVPTSAIFSPPASLPEDYRNQLKSRLSLPSTNRTLPEHPSPHERYLAGMGVTLANWISWVLLRKFEFKPDMLAGQSQGEMTALAAAGATDFHESAPFMWKMLNVDPGFREGECMAFAWISSEALEPILEMHPGAAIAIDLAPNAVIFGGRREAIEQIATLLHDQRVLVQILPFPPIHTPQMSRVRDELLAVLDKEKVPIKKAQVDLYSSITVDKYPDDADGIRDALLLNLDHPVRLWQTINRLYDEGARIFIQAGGGNFASHVMTLLDAKGDVCSTPLDIDARNPLTQLNHLCATLFTAGVSLTFAPLYEHRTVRRLDFDSPQPASTSRSTAIPLRVDWTPLAHQNVPKRTVAQVPDTPAHGAPIVDRPIDPGSTASIPDSARAAAVGPVPPMPLLGPLVRFVPDHELVMRRTLDLSEDLYLHDHLFVHAPSLKPPDECLPTLPMTVGMELMAEAAALLSPGLGLIGFENVRALHWIALYDQSQLDLEIEAHVQTADPHATGRRVDVVVLARGRRCAAATVVFDVEYPHDFDFQIGHASDDGADAWPLTAEDIYARRRMFHGPLFQTLTGLNEFGNPAHSGELTVLPKHDAFRSTSDPHLLTDPFVLDGVGQLVGLWCQMHDWFVFPTGVDKVELFGPTPPPGTVVAIRCEVVEFDLDLRTFKANIEVEDGHGGLWMRLAGWSDWLFKWPAKFCEWMRNPFSAYSCDVIDLPNLPAGSICTYLTRAHLKNSDTDRIARILLHREEMPEFRTIDDENRRWQFVCSRMASKDAGRIWLGANCGFDAVHPAELVVAHEETGRPFLWCADDRPLPRISVAHSGTTAVALASDHDVGIDIEPLASDPQALLDYAATPAEAELINAMTAAEQDESWATRLWCAKEAVGKLLGTGLQGRPTDIVAIEVNDSGQLLMEHQPSGARFVVDSVRLDEMIAAYSSADQLVTEALPSM